MTTIEIYLFSRKIWTWIWTNQPASNRQYQYYAPVHRAWGIKRWCASDVWLPVCRVHRA